ncbi:hypothetical protein GCM10025789_00030 [Tessaracoccus lubricantis]|uniref:CARDB domain-containing protein n=1 Tax=Tessaracoccus lubricantis TaxID=545543 RepID=A0ABP9EWB8_9ACTN
MKWGTDMDFRTTLAAVALSGLILTGCTGTGEQSPSPDTPTGSTSATGTEAPSVEPTESSTPAVEPSPIAHGERETIPTLGAEEAGIASDVDLKECGLEAGAVSATGTVTNSADEARDVVVAVIWLGKDGSGSSLSVKVFQEAGVPAGESRDFTLETEIPADASRCVLNARSAPAGALG